MLDSAMQRGRLNRSEKRIKGLSLTFRKNILTHLSDSKEALTRNRTFPIYPVILFKALSIRLITGPPPALASTQASSKALPRHKRPLRWVKGSPLFTSDGELVGSLHVDNIASHTVGVEVECLIIAYSKEPIAGSALPMSQESVGDYEDWNLFWIMHVVEKDGIYERRGVGQVLDSVLAKSCVGSEGKVILLG